MALAMGFTMGLATVLVDSDVGLAMEVGDESRQLGLTMGDGDGADG